MASVEVGRVYVIHTTLTKPVPKEKIVICICAKDNLFVWFNTAAQRHGVGQLKCAAGDHPALSHDCYLDLSRVTTFRSDEIANAKPRDLISDKLKARICEAVKAGIATLAPRFTSLISDNFSNPVA
jgi:hypothetical protein